MTVKRLEEDFRRMGLSNNEIRESLANMSHGIEADLGEEDTEVDDFESDVYLSDLVDGDDGDDEMDEAMKIKKTHRTSSAEKRQSRQYYKTHRQQILKTRGKKRKQPGYKKHLAKLAKKPARKGYRRTIEGVDMGIHESLMDELNILAEAIEGEPVSRFDEYVEAFNHIADLGEMAAMQVMDEDEDAALDLISLSLNAEAVLKEMEEMGGAITIEEDDILEETLADAMEQVGDMFEYYGFLTEDEGPEDEDEGEDEDDGDGDDDDLEEDIIDSDNPFFAAAASLREARAKRRPVKQEKRKIMTSKGVRTRGGKSKWAKGNPAKNASKRQLALRGDVIDQGAMLNYLRQVKLGRVAPGQPLMKTKSGKTMPIGARKAIRAAKKGRKKAG